MLKQQFEPYQDRLSRDIRNALSESISRVIGQRDMAPAQAVAERYLARDPAPCYRNYITDRMARYAAALQIITETGLNEPFAIGLALWDLELFFEVHEVLEHAWLKARGAEKLILQAMIRAAGFYIKREYGYNDAAAKMAGRAVTALEENRAAAPAGFDLELLVRKLHALDPIPPKLRTEA